MKSKFVFVSQIVLAASLLLGCSNKQTVSTKVGPFVISSQTTRIHEIDLDKINGIEVHPEMSFGLTSERLGASDAIDLVEDQLFVADARNDSIFVFNLNNDEPVRSFGGAGSGPGEFSFPGGIWSNKDHLLVHEQMGLRLQLLEKDGKYVKQWVAKHPLSSSYGLSDRFIYLSLGQVSDTSDLIERCSIDSNSGACDSFGERVSIKENVNETYDFPLISVTNEDVVALAYVSLSYLFIFNEALEVTDVISFSGELVSSLEHPWVSKTPKLTGPYKVFFTALAIEEDGTIWIAHKKSVFILSKSPSGEYTLTSRYDLTVPVSGIVPNGAHFYTSSMVRPAAYGFSVPK